MKETNCFGLFLQRDADIQALRDAAIECGMIPVILNADSYVAIIGGKHSGIAHSSRAADAASLDLRFLITDREESEPLRDVTGSFAVTGGNVSPIIRLRHSLSVGGSPDSSRTFSYPLDPSSALWLLKTLLHSNAFAKEPAGAASDAAALPHFPAVYREGFPPGDSQKKTDGEANSLRIQLRAVLDTIREPIVVLDRSQNLVLCNTAATQLLGLTEPTASKEALARVFEVFLPSGDLLPQEDWPSVRALAGDFLKGFEVVIKRRDSGRVVVAEIDTAPIRSSAGEIEEVVISYRDVTESRKASEARTRLAAIVESSDDAIIGKDMTGIVTSWNGGAEKVFGYTASEILGQSIRRLLPTGRESEEDEILARIGRGEIVDHIETERIRKDGRLIEVSLTISPIRDAMGRVCGASKIARDITDRRRLERQLQQSQKMEAVGQLTGGIAHDFNNLLGVIVGNLELLERQVTGNEEAMKRLRTAQKGVTRGTDLTRRLLAFSSNENLRPTITSLNGSIQNVVDMAARALGPEIKITMNLDPSIPPIFVDIAGLESALLNLSVNARDAMPNGGSLTLTTQLRHLEESYPPVRAGELLAGPHACISISDTGEGMTKEVLLRAFEPFFTTKPRGKGTGLGLAMVYGFVKQSRGTVRIYSEPGYGTTVSIYLPLAGGQALSANTNTFELMANRGNSVLVVDDEEELLEIASTFLQEMNYDVHLAANGADAIALFSQLEHVDLLITDVIMPGGMNGVELALQLRRAKPSLSVIYCSGFPADALAERTMPLVDGPLLRKPYQREEFSGIVRQTMGADPEAGLQEVNRNGKGISPATRERLEDNKIR